MVAGAVVGLLFGSALWFIWIALGVWGFSLIGARRGENKIDPRPFVKAFRDADEWVQRELDSLARQSGLSETLKLHSDLVTTIAAYEGHDATLARELVALASTREARQRMAYLDQFSIRGAAISGIGPAKTAALISFGVETAADVTPVAVSRVPGFGDVLTRKLMDWRRYHESRFQYVQSTTAQDSADERALRASFGSRKAKLEATIRSGTSALRSSRGRLEALPERAARNAALTKALEARAQAEYDLKALGVPIPTSTVHMTPTAPSKRAPQPPPTPVSTKPLSPRAPVTTRIPVCPRCGSSMRRRSGRYGAFWGCSRFPRCKGTRKV